MDQKQLIGRARALLGDLDQAKRFVRDEAESISLSLAGGEGLESVARPRSLEEYLEAGVNGLDKIQRDGEDAVLEEEEESGLEAIILVVGRPAIVIHNDTFAPVDVPPDWRQLNDFQNSIREVCRSVGRIDLTGHPRGMAWVGTGFLVAKDVVMTNRHVAKEFCTLGNDGKWALEPEIAARIDFRKEAEGAPAPKFDVVDVIDIRTDVDMALIRISTTAADGSAAPPPLPLAMTPPDPVEQHDVYVMGHPAWDGQRNDSTVMARIFAGIYDVKRLQPGKITQFIAPRFRVNHDCSTLGGNSGSCVANLESGQVLGLHYSGTYLETNRAVALWTLQNDPKLQSLNWK